MLKKPLRKPRRVRSSITIQSALLDMLEQAPYLATHEVFLGPCGQEKVAVGWDSIREEMLRTHGQDRSPQQWKQAWRDLKSNCRRRAADKRDSALVSGESEAGVLTPVEERVLRLIGEAAAFGLDDSLPSPPVKSDYPIPADAVEVKVEVSDHDSLTDVSMDHHTIYSQASVRKSPGEVDFSERLTIAMETQARAMDRLASAVERQTQVLQEVAQSIQIMLQSNAGPKV